MARDFLHQRGKIFTPEHQSGGADGIGGAGIGHLLQDILPEQFGRAFVQFDKVGRNPGLERKAAQQARAKTVDRLNPQTTRRFNRAGEQTPCAGEVGRVELCQFAQFRQRIGERCVRHHRPFAQAVKQTVLHLARGGFGIGQAQNPLRFNVLQQQAGHTVGQNPGLARPRIGRKPGGRGGVGGGDLGRGGVMRGHLGPP